MGIEVLILGIQGGYGHTGNIRRAAEGDCRGGSPPYLGGLWLGRQHWKASERFEEMAPVLILGGYGRAGNIWRAAEGDRRSGST